MAVVTEKEEEEDCAVGCYGNLPLIQSTEKPDRTLERISSLGVERVDAIVWVRGRLHTSRSKGLPAFFTDDQYFVDLCHNNKSIIIII